MKVKRKINKVFIHCSASDFPQHDNIATIKKWHLEKGFSDIGYHFVITKNGQIFNGRNIEKIPAAQCGYNTNSIAICLTGMRNFSSEQYSSLKKLCAEINNDIKNVTFHGHCEVSSKPCPVFDYKTVLNLENGILNLDSKAEKLNDIDSKTIMGYGKNFDIQNKTLVNIWFIAKYLFTKFFKNFEDFL